MSAHSAAVSHSLVSASADGGIGSTITALDPTRPRIGDENRTQTDKAWQIQTLYDATLMEVHEDFGSDLIDRVMPRSRDWLSYEPDTTLDEAMAKALEPEFKRRTDIIFAAIRQSNLYDEAAGAPNEGIAPGTRWEDIPPNWTCPECGARKDDFEMVAI